MIYNRATVLIIVLLIVFFPSLGNMKSNNLLQSAAYNLLESHNGNITRMPDSDQNEEPQNIAIISVDQDNTYEHLDETPHRHKRQLKGLYRKRKMLKHIKNQ